MNQKYIETFNALTASDQIFAFREPNLEKGEIYQEFTNIPNTMKEYFEIGLLHPEIDWLIFEKERYTYKEIYLYAARVANQLLADGINKGDRVAICMPNNPEYIILFIAITSIGAVCVPLNSWWVGSEIEYALKDCGAKIIFGDSKRLKSIESFDVLKISVRGKTTGTHAYEEWLQTKLINMPETPIYKDDYTTIFYTSGSTGFPKGVLSSHKNILSGLFSWALYSTLRNAVYGDGLTEAREGVKPSILHCVPLFHVTGSHAGFLMSVMSGRKMVMVSKWDTLEAMRLIQDEKVTNITGVPTMTWEILTHPARKEFDLSSLQDLGGGGAHRPPEHVKKLAEEFNNAKPSIGYGLTETNAIGTLNGGDDYLTRPASCGRVVPPVTQLAIIDQKWKFLNTEGQIGEIVIKSPANMVGYWNKPEATAEVMKDGWFRTGDLGYIEDGFLFIIDRVKDLVIRGGENISCIEVESVISEHPAVFEVAVFGIPDDRLGEVLCAAVSLKTNNSLLVDELKVFLEAKLAAFKIPLHIMMQSEPLPKVASGKFDKPFLRNKFATILKQQT
ncbi:MAG: class I adenylate-forming enzyme family protein [Gammaproteobacteria bacterium]